MTLRPPETPMSLPVQGGGTGAAVMLLVMFVYQLVRISWHVASTLTSHNGAPAVPEGVDRIIGIYILGGLLSLAPVTLAGGVLGTLLGTLLAMTWERQGPLRSWLTGTLLAYVVALAVNATVLLRHRKTSLPYAQWEHLLGYPSVVFVIAFGGIGVWLYLSRRDPKPTPATSF